jgi:hypothetical protein
MRRRALSRRRSTPASQWLIQPAPAICAGGRLRSLSTSNSATTGAGAKTRAAARSTRLACGLGDVPKPGSALRFSFEGTITRRQGGESGDLEPILTGQLKADCLTTSGRYRKSGLKPVNCPGRRAGNLRASCQNTNGRWERACLAAYSCTSHRAGNQDGRLVCEQ